MCAHRRRRIDNRGTILNGQTFNWVGIVTCPDLGRIVQHTGVKPSAAAGASFQKQVRECIQKPFKQCVQTQHIPVTDFFLLFRRQESRADFSQIAVKVPLDIFNLCTAEDIRNPFKEVVLNILSGHIQNILPSCGRVGTSRQLKCPIRMRAVKVGVRGDHFRFKPDAHLHTEFMQFIRQMTQTQRQFIFIDIPVTQRGMVIISVSKPAVVHNQHFNAERSSSTCNFQQLLFVESEVGCFPVVDDDWAVTVTPGTTNQVTAVQFMIGTAHTADTLIGIDHNGFRCVKLFTRLQLPAKTIRIDTAQYTGLT